MNTGKLVVFGAGVAGLVVAHKLVGWGSISDEGASGKIVVMTWFMMVIWLLIRFFKGIRGPLSYCEQVAVSLYPIYGAFWLGWGFLEGKGLEIIAPLIPIVMGVASVPAAVLVVAGMLTNRAIPQLDAEPDGGFVIIRSRRVWRKTVTETPLQPEDAERLGRK